MMRMKDTDNNIHDYHDSPWSYKYHILSPNIYLASIVINELDII